MPTFTRVWAPRAALFVALGLLAACSQPLVSRAVTPLPLAEAGPGEGINLTLSSKAVAEAKAKRARGERVWCVPFARTMSGIDLRGDAKLWWGAAEGVYARGKDPRVGAVMVFSGSRAMRRGHIGVVSAIISDREILLDNANWIRNQVTLGMRVVDVSEAGDWSAVKVAGPSGVLGRVNPISGFIYPQRLAGPV